MIGDAHWQALRATRFWETTLLAGMCAFDFGASRAVSLAAAHLHLSFIA